jgi:GxxExxY protein
MSDLLYRQEVFQLVGYCMEIHRELGRGHDEVVYKDAFVVELNRASVPFIREKNYQILYKGVLLPHAYYADFVVWDKTLFEAKAAEKLAEAHVKQVLNYLAASKLRLGLLVNFGADSLEWKRIMTWSLIRANSCNSCQFFLTRIARISTNWGSAGFL